MNIAMVVYSHYSRDARVRKYAEILAENKHSVDIICLKENYNPRSKNIRLVFYPVERRRYNKIWYLIEYLLFFFFALINLAVRSINIKYQIIHVHNMPDFLVFTAAFPKLTGSKIILDMHDPMPELYLSKYKVNNSDFILNLIRFSEKFALNFADIVITANFNFKKIFIKRYPGIRKKISVIQNFPDEKIFIPGKKSAHKDNFVLMYMGTIEERYDLFPAIEAIPKLILKIPELKFNIIPKIKTEGNYYRKLKKLISDLNLDYHVRILPPLPVEGIAREIKNSDIGIILLKKDIFTENIVPVKLLEFVFMEKPVIATKTKALSGIFPPGSLHFLNENSSGEFISAVTKLYNDKNLANNLANTAKKYFKTFNWKTESGIYLKLIAYFNPEVFSASQSPQLK